MSEGAKKSLEAITGLKERGLITQKEFDKRKKELLSKKETDAKREAAEINKNPQLEPPPLKPSKKINTKVVWSILAILVIVGGFATGLFQSFTSAFQKSFEKSYNDSKTTIEKSDTDNSVVHAPISPKSSLAFVFQPKILGAQIEYLESGLGPAISVDYNKDRHYEVEGCDVVVGTGDGKSVQSLTLKSISKKCDFDLSRFIVGWPQTANLTFGDFDERIGIGAFSADCLSSCGNAYDPSVYVHFEGSHAQGFIEVVAETQLVGEAALEASEKWQTAMKSEGDDYVLENKFNCDGKYDKEAHDFFKQVNIQNISIGTHFDDQVRRLNCK